MFPTRQEQYEYENAKALQLLDDASIDREFAVSVWHSDAGLAERFEARARRREAEAMRLMDEVRERNSARSER